MRTIYLYLCVALIFCVLMYLAVLVLCWIADHLPALPGQHVPQLRPPVMALHHPLHLGQGKGNIVRVNFRTYYIL